MTAPAARLPRRARGLAARASTALVLVLTCVAPASAGGGRYLFAGGTAHEQAQVRAALEASSFDWGLVPLLITIHIAPGLDSCALPGHVILDADLLDSGRFAWGVVQHEYAHQVDFFVLDDPARARLAAALGGSSWWQTATWEAHGDLTGERFASSLAWAYWPSAENVMRPESAEDEAGSLPPLAFRALLSRLLGAAVPGQRTLEKPT
ncbi:MAG TPA: hypothetical protein VGJ25_03185 [Gaiellaceae bacterium]